MLPWSSPRAWLAFLGSVAATIAIAVLLVHAFAPAGLSRPELLIHVITLTIGFASGIGLAAWLISRLGSVLPAGGVLGRRTVGQLWIISGLGFVLGAFIAGAIEQFAPLSQVAEKAAATHGPVNMLPGLLAIWIIWTLFMVRAEVLKSYEARFVAVEKTATRAPPAPASAAGPTIEVESGKETHRLAVAEIVSISAEQNYCRFEMRDATGPARLLLRCTLHAVAEQLPRSRFVQVHRSHLVNRAFVERVERRGRGFLVVVRDRDERIPVSRYRLEQVLTDLEEGD